MGFGLLPIFPTLALTPVALPPGWVIVVAGLLGISAHFANALPDLHTDAAQGIRGLPQVLGPRLSGTVLVVGVVGATLAITVFGTTLPLWVRVLTAALALLAAVIAAALAVRPIPPRVIFPLVMASAVVCTGAIAAHFFLSGVG
jgi:4-hydroxybenzoate polyprenyltransferase